MANKPLKLKSFITEEEAARLLSQLIGEEVSSLEMAEYASTGVVPAYIQFPSTELPGDGFYLLSQKDDLNMYAINEGLRREEDTEWEMDTYNYVDHLPYPFLKNWHGCVRTTKGHFVSAYVMTEDGRHVKIGDADSYPRIYAPAEICEVARILNDPLACPEWPAVKHNHSPTWDAYEDGSNTSYKIIGPYDWDKLPSRGTPAGFPDEIKGERRVNWPLIVAAMWEELRDEWKKQGTLAEKIGGRGWKGARKDDVNHALSKANRAKEEVER